MASTRERYLDISKGFGIWCIVLLHFENGFFPSRLNIFIGSFMISVFYIIAGIIMAKKTSVQSTGQLFRHRFRQLGMPYLWWSAIIIVFDCLLWGLHYYDGYFIAREIYKTIVLNGTGTLWFLPALFFGEIAWHYMKDKRTIYILIFMIAIIVYGCFFSYLFDGHSETIYKIVRAPFLLLKRVCDAALYIASGYYFYRKCGKWIQETDSRKLLGCGLALCVFSYLTACHLHSFAGNADNFLWKFLAPISGPIAVILLAKSLEKTAYMNFFDFWGVNSLCLMLIHYSIILVICQMVDKYIYNNDSYFGIHTLVYFIVSMPVLYSVTLLLNAKAKFLLGK